MYEILLQLLSDNSITQSWAIYVDGNFTDTQLALFKFILNSFPESMLILDNDTPNEDVISVLALIAYGLGNSKELINNLKLSKSIEELYNDVESNATLADEDKILILLLADDMMSNLFTSDMTVDEKLNVLINYRYLAIDSYKYVKNRGTLETLERIIAMYLVSIDRLDVRYTINKSSTLGRIEIAMDLIDDIIDYFSESLVSPEDPTGWEEWVAWYHIKKDSVLYRLIEKTRPAGIAYDIIMGSYADPLPLASPILTFVEGSENYVNKTYSVTIENPTSLYVTAYIGDYQHGLTMPTEGLTVVSLSPFQTRTINRTANNTGFANDGEVTDIRAYITYETLTSELSTLVQHTTTLPIQPGQLVLTTNDVSISKSADALGGYIIVTATNNNLINVTASVTTEWDGPRVSFRSFTVQTEPNFGYIIVRNPLYAVSDVSVTVTLYANGYTPSNSVVKTASGVAAKI